MLQHRVDGLWIGPFCSIFHWPSSSFVFWKTLLAYQKCCQNGPSTLIWKMFRVPSIFILLTIIFWLINVLNIIIPSLLLHRRYFNIFLAITHQLMTSDCVFMAKPSPPKKGLQQSSSWAKNLISVVGSTCYKSPWFWPMSCSKHLSRGIRRKNKTIKLIGNIIMDFSFHPMTRLNWADRKKKNHLLPFPKILLGHQCIENCRQPSM